MSKFIVEYSLPYDHIVQVGVEADSSEQACAEAEAAFNAGTIWDDTPEMPLLYDDYEEQEGDSLNFAVARNGANVDAFPPAAPCVRIDQAKTLAIQVVKELVRACAKAAGCGGKIAWGDLDQILVHAQQALGLLNYPAAPARQGVDQDAQQDADQDIATQEIPW